MYFNAAMLQLHFEHIAFTFVSLIISNRSNNKEDLGKTNKIYYSVGWVDCIYIYI